MLGWQKEVILGLLVRRRVIQGQCSDFRRGTGAVDMRIEKMTVEQ